VRETIYEHLDGNDTFTVTAAERWSIGMIRRLAEKHPNDVVIAAENDDGSLVAHIPSSWMRISPKRTRDLTDEQRQVLSERMLKARAARKDGNE
jgi:hypothetical protein